MRLGLTIVGDSLDHFRQYVQQADTAGVAAIGTGDSQTLYGEVWMRCTLAGMLASRARVGPWATNPVTRHPSVTAGAAATLAELTVERLRDLKKLGVEQLWSPVRFADKAPLMRAVCEDLMPHLAQL
jgi:hypothetical protein